MRASTHMRKHFDSGSRGGRIIKGIDSYVSEEKPEGLWLEWTPGSKVSRSDGYRLETVSNGSHEPIWKATLKIKGEQKYVLRLGPISESAVGQVRTFLDTNLKPGPRESRPASPKEEKGTPVVTRTHKEPQPPVPPPAQEPAAVQHPLPMSACSADLVRDAIGEIIRNEKLSPVDEWYTIAKFGEKILIMFAHSEAEKLQVRANLPRLLDRLASAGRIKYEKKPKYRGCPDQDSDTQGDSGGACCAGRNNAHRGNGDSRTANSAGHRRTPKRRTGAGGTKDGQLRGCYAGQGGDKERPNAQGTHTVPRAKVTATQQAATPESQGSGFFYTKKMLV